MICTHPHDKRAKKCKSCSLQDKPRLGTGQGWKLHKQTGYIIGYINGISYYQHRYVMEQHLKRKLLTKEHVHHINHNRTDNRLENLELISASDHGREHHALRAKELSYLGHKARWGYVSNLCI